MRRARTLVEVMTAIGLLSVLIGSVAPGAILSARRQAALGTWIDDLRAGARMADALAREVREATAVVPIGPGGGHRTSATTLLLARPGGELVALLVERRRPASPGWLVRVRLDAGGRELRREVLGQLEALGLRFDQRPSIGVVAVAVDLTLPRRTEGAKEALLSTYALVGDGEALR